jgi:hypothetical protein
VKADAGESLSPDGLSAFVFTIQLFLAMLSLFSEDES